jgi:hypothetical protein
MNKQEGNTFFNVNKPFISWQEFINLPHNKRLHILEAKKKYLEEQKKYYNIITPYQAIQGYGSAPVPPVAFAVEYLVIAGGGGGGGGKSGGGAWFAGGGGGAGGLISGSHTISTLEEYTITVGAGGAGGTGGADIGGAGGNASAAPFVGGNI